MSQLEVYFPNHQKALKFPWSLYHGPLLQSLKAFFQTAHSGDEVLVVGPGAFAECEWLLAKGLKVSILDIDPRVLELHKEAFGDRLAGYYLVNEQYDGYPQSNFDFIYGKEVIEHLLDYETFLKKIFSLLRVNGLAWMSTPNYGFFLLPLLEKTVLEVIARLSGFSRKDIHPSRFNKHTLNSVFSKAGFSSVEIQEMPYKLSLVGIGKKQA